MRNQNTNTINNTTSINSVKLPQFSYLTNYSAQSETKPLTKPLITTKSLSILLTLSILSTASLNCFANTSNDFSIEDKKRKEEQASLVPANSVINTEELTKEEIKKMIKLGSKINHGDSSEKITDEELKRNFLLYDSLSQKTKIYLNYKWSFDRHLSLNQETILLKADRFFSNQEGQKLLEKIMQKKDSKLTAEEDEVLQEFLKHLKELNNLNQK